MAFLETPRFPDDIARGSSGGPEFNTSVVILSSGFEQRNANWSEPLGMWDVAYGLKAEEDVYIVVEFFNAVAGRNNGFRFKDWQDYKSVSPELAPSSTDQLIGTGDGVKTVFQIIKTYTTGVLSQVKTIKKTVTGTVLVALNDVTQGAGFTVNNNTGEITFAPAPGGAVTVKAGYEFDRPSRFDIDHLRISLDDFRARTIPQIPIREIRV